MSSFTAENSKSLLSIWNLEGGL